MRLVQLPRDKVHHHRHFLAVGEEGAAHALIPDLLRELHHVGKTKAHLFEEAGPVGQREHAIKAELAGIFDAGGNDARTDTLPLYSL